MPNISGTRTFNVTLLSVCIDAETVELAVEAAEERNWALTQASFQTYISGRRRPHFGDNLRAGDGCVALVDFDADPKEAVAATNYLQQVFGGHIVVAALATENQPQLMLLAMRAGCTEFLTKPVEPRAFTEAFRGMEQQFANRSATAHAAGSIISLVGAKGGVGTTTLAVHLGTYLARREGKKVLLIDNRAQFGHVCVYLGLDETAHHFQEVVRNVDRLDSELLRGFIATHSSGLDVLSSPDAGHVARAMAPDDVTATLEFLRSEYDLVLMDCADTLDPINNAAIALSSQTYMIATPEIGAIRDLSRHIDELAKKGCGRRAEDTNKVRAVINRCSSQFAVSLEEIEKAIRLPVSFGIPNCFAELVRSANLGEPLSPEVGTGFTKEITRWTDSLVGPPPSKAAVETADVPATAIWKGLKSTLFGSVGPVARVERKQA